MSNDRLRHLENQLEILQEQRAALEQEALMKGGLTNSDRAGIANNN